MSSARGYLRLTGDVDLIIWGNVLRVPVVSLPTLWAMKREAGRPQDLADIDALGKGAP